MREKKPLWAESTAKQLSQINTLKQKKQPSSTTEALNKQQTMDKLVGYFI